VRVDKLRARTGDDIMGHGKAGLWATRKAVRHGLPKDCQSGLRDSPLSSSGALNKGTVGGASAPCLRKYEGGGKGGGP
jgi:hypothetical protein